MTTVDFEWALVGALNDFFQARGVMAIAYRLKQSRYASQTTDILVDSLQPRYYLAIECKSLDSRRAKALYFTQHFNTAKGVHQIDRETEFLNRSGRRGILAVELRRGPGKPRSAHLIPWRVILEMFQSGRRGLPLDEIEHYSALKRHGGSYRLEDWEGG